MLWPSEVDKFAKVFFNPQFKTAHHAKLNGFLDPAVERFKALPEDAAVEGRITQDDLKHTMLAFTRLYSFLSQIKQFQDIELEKLFPISGFCSRNCPKNPLRNG